MVFDELSCTQLTHSYYIAVPSEMSYWFKLYYCYLYIAWQVYKTTQNTITIQPLSKWDSEKRSKFCLIDWFFTSQQQLFSDVGTTLPGLHQYLARINVSCPWAQRSGADQARTRGPSVSSQALYHWVTALPMSHCVAFHLLKHPLRGF